MSARVASQRHTRPKKLGYKQNVPIFRENEIDLIDLDGRQASNIETGVEAAEQNEYHLVAAIKATQDAEKAKDAYIPTPPTIDSSIQYDVLYPQKFEQPATYIKSSATVEDCSGVQYCLDEEDEAALTKMNSNLKNDSKPCSEDHFEAVMNFFEESAQTKQPFATVDNTPVLTLQEVEEQINDAIGPAVKLWYKSIYEHWRSRRLQRSNHSVQPSLKFETSPDADDADPYVCFRRREVRQIRKTRGRDAQSAEKLRRLRKELDDARMLVMMIKQREIARKEQIVLERQLFRQRCEVKETKRKLGIKGGDDDDLINQKPKKKPEVVPPSQQLTTPQLRFPVARAGPNDDLRVLDDVQVEKEKAISKEIQSNVERHIKWNEGFVDKTRAPLTPISVKNFGSDFRQAMPTTEYLPTPPASVSDEENEMTDAGSPKQKNLSDDMPNPFRYATPPTEDIGQTIPSFRRRIGRGGRLMFDRRMPSRPKDQNVGGASYDRFKYDSDDEDDEEIIDVDPHDLQIMSHNAYLYAKAFPAPTDQIRRQIETNAAPQQVQAPSANSSSIPITQKST